MRIQSADREPIDTPPLPRRRHPAPLGPLRPILLGLLLGFLPPTLRGAETTNAPPAASDSALGHALLLETAGRVEIARAGTNTWTAASPGTRLAPGDRVRTGPDSRATLMLSDHSVIRLDRQTLLLIQSSTPEPARHRFRLDLGRLFFFDREDPPAVEFETPLAAGAIRGTEFVLSAGPGSEPTRLFVLDGAVELTSADETRRVGTGEVAEVRPGEPPQTTALLNAISPIQWALYYPAVLDPGELPLDDADRDRLRTVLTRYGRGDLLQALAAFPPDGLPVSVEARALLANLKLAVGNVEEAEALLAALPAEDPAANALRELMGAVQGQVLPPTQPPRSASQWLARSYLEQARSDLPAALAAAEQATRQSPEFGFAEARVAQLQLAFGRWWPAREALDRASLLSPDNPLVPTLRGFLELDTRRGRPAQEAFDRALQMDAALGLAWLGRGLAWSLLGRSDLAEQDLQVAAALEPQRSLYRSSLARAYADRGADSLALRELDLAKRLDPFDPTPWLYQALVDWQGNQPNQAVRSLETSRVLNDNRSLFRSRLLLDRDAAVRSADLAAIYHEAGLPEVGARAASRAVVDDYSGFEGHLFLANEYQQLEDLYRTDLRYESARQSELLVANLLAPPGGGNLSQLLSQQDHLQYLDERPAGLSTLTEFTSEGNWLQSGSAFGTLGDFSYALDAQYRNLEGDWANQDLQEFYLSAQVKEQIGYSDALYLQAGFLDLDSGDTARSRTPEEVNLDYRVEEKQRPFVYAGWSHEWGPGSHTLLLASYLEDHLSITDPELSLPFVRMSGGQPVSITAAPLFAYDSTSTYRLGSVELQQIWQTDSRTLVIGGRAQSGQVDTQATLGRALTGSIAHQDLDPDLTRFSVYAYHDWQIVEPLHFTVGLSYDYLSYPANVSLPPLTDGESNRDAWSPKVGLLWTPSDRSEIRVAYAESLGGLFFDNSLRLEPTQVAGWNQTYRSLIPESVVGQVPGSRFQTLGGSADYAFPTDTYAGVYGEWLRTDGERTVGVMTNSTILPLPDSPSGTSQTLDYEEAAAGIYLRQMLGSQVTVGARYRFSEAWLDTALPSIPAGTPGLDAFEASNVARLHQVNLAGQWFHPNGFFAGWDSGYFYQTTESAAGSGPSESFWQHNAYVGYRLHARRAEVRVGVLNITDTDYRLDPLNFTPVLPRGRTVAVTLRLNF